MSTVTIPASVLLSLPPEHLLRVLDHHQVALLVVKCVKDGAVDLESLVRSESSHDDDVALQSRIVAEMTVLGRVTRDGKGKATTYAAAQLTVPGA